MKSKTVVRYHLSPVRTVTEEKTKCTDAAENVEKKETSSAAEEKEN